jgi:hypothetical protein
MRNEQKWTQDTERRPTKQKPKRWATRTQQTHRHKPMCTRHRPMCTRGSCFL